jgi:hypothetical protein
MDRKAAILALMRVTPMRIEWSRKYVAVGFAIVVAVLYVGISAAVSISRFVHERRTQQIAEELRNEANRDAQPSWTEVEARSWLQDRGFEHIWGGKGSRWNSKGILEATNGPTEHFVIVSGTRNTAEKGLFVKSQWVQLAFIFDLDHHLKRVESQIVDHVPFQNDG